MTNKDQYNKLDSLNNSDSESILPPKRKKTYEENRQHHKNGFISSTILLFKSTIGLGLLMNQYYLAKSGLIAGPITTILMCLLTMYSMYLLLKISDEEEKKSLNHQIENYDHLGKVVYGVKFQYVCKIFCFGYNMTAILANTLNFAKFLQNEFSGYTENDFFKNIFFYKLIVVLFFLILLLFILEPEKLKYPSYFGAGILIIALFLMWTDNFLILKNRTKNIDYDFINFPAIPDLVGNQLYALESIASVFTVRATMKKRSQMKKSLILSYFICCILFSFNGISFLIVFLKRVMVEII